MATTKRGKYRFVVKEYPDGIPWILMEPLQTDIELTNDGFIGFELSEGIRLKEAEEIADYLDEKIKQVTLTTFETTEMEKNN